MSSFDIEIDGGRRSVWVEARSSAADLIVTVDGRAYQVDAAHAGDSTLSLIIGDTIRSSYAVTVVDEQPSGELTFRLPDGTTPRAIVESSLRRRRHAGTERDRDGEQKITAPMPGRVVRVLVAVGDEVAAGQPVIVVEAMKMENELRSPKAGRVKTLAAESGMSVDAGRLLVVIE
jgi:biotin carboxyl carrier protein